MQPAPAEQQVRSAIEAGDRDRAVTALLRGYGAELLGYLEATMPDRPRAREAYAVLAEDLWKGLPDFEWRCSARAWAYTLARHARARCLRTAHRAAKRERHVEEMRWLSELVERTRTPTPLHLRSEVKSKMRELRSRLSDDEQTLLMLRIDRAMSWNDLAVVLEEPMETEADLARSSARLRKRFASVKDKLRAMAVEAGLLHP